MVRLEWPTMLATLPTAGAGLELPLAHYYYHQLQVMVLVHQCHYQWLVLVLPWLQQNSVVAIVYKVSTHGSFDRYNHFDYFARP